MGFVRRRRNHESIGQMVPEDCEGRSQEKHYHIQTHYPVKKNWII